MLEVKVTCTIEGLSLRKEKSLRKNKLERLKLKIRLNLKTKRAVNIKVIVKNI